MKRILVLSILLIPFLSIAQVKTVSNHSITINTIGASYNYEQKISPKFTIVGHAGLITTLLGWSNDDFEFALNPGIGVEPRFYYNLDKRSTQNKRTNINSGNYLSADCEYVFKAIAHSDNVKALSGVLIAPCWGLRRVYNDMWLLEFSTGVNFVINSASDVAWSPRANLKFGIVF